MEKYTHNENRNALNAMTIQAIEAGFITTDQRFSYEQGNGNYAIPTRIRLQELRSGKVGELRWENISNPMWIPEFSWKEGPTTVGRTLTVMSNMFYDIIRRKQEAAREENRRKMQYLSEHTARRSE